MKQPDVVMVVDDEVNFRENVAERLEMRGYRVLSAGGGEPALNLARENRIGVAVVDILMPGMDGLTLLDHLKDLDPLLEVIMVTGAGSVETAVRAIQNGAYHYVTKPVRLNELEILVQRAAEKERLARQNILYRENLRRRRARTGPVIVGGSRVMAGVLHESEKLAQLDAPVLIEGETGTGKELLFEYIHHHSARAQGPMMVLNCGALTEQLVDAELFGHEKGAFTGAVEARSGMVEVSDEGSLLLDEIGDIPHAAQIRLLRFLERGVFRKMGSTREQSVDVRIIAATHQNLDKAVSEGRFREDLFHRLHVFRITLPPLRERREDIVPLARHFLATQTKLSDLTGGFTDPACTMLEAYPWPGNVRELAHAVERAAFSAHLAGANRIEPGHLKLSSPSGSLSPLLSMKEAERLHVESVLSHFGGSRQKAAEVLGITERHLYRILKRYKEEE